MMTTLKLWQVAVESVPQLCTQWLILGYEVVEEIDKGVKEQLLQSFVIITSTLTTIRCLTAFVASFRRQKLNTVMYPAVTSSIPISAFLSTGLFAATVQMSFVMATLLPKEFTAAGGLILYRDSTSVSIIISLMCLNIINFLFSIVVLCLSFDTSLRGRVIRSIFHILTSGTAIAFCISLVFVSYDNVLKGNSVSWAFYATFVGCFSHFLLGLLILPSKNLASWLWAPLILLVVKFLKKIINCCCLTKWRPSIQAALENAVLMQGEGVISRNRNGEHKRWPRR